MSGYNDSENMKTLEEFGRPDYLFFVDDDIFKFYQMSGIGDRQTWFDSLSFKGVYENHFENKEEYPDMAVFETSGALLKEDMVIEGNFYDGESTYIREVYVPVNNGSFGPAKVAVHYSGHTSHTPSVPEPMPQRLLPLSLVH